MLRSIDKLHSFSKSRATHIHQVTCSDVRATLFSGVIPCIQITHPQNIPTLSFKYFMHYVLVSHKKETARGGRLDEISAHSLQCCDWLTWQHTARSVNNHILSTLPPLTVSFVSTHAVIVAPYLRLENIIASDYLGEYDQGECKRTKSIQKSFPPISFKYFMH